MTHEDDVAGLERSPRVRIETSPVKPRQQQLSRVSYWERREPVT